MVQLQSDHAEVNRFRSRPSHGRGTSTVTPAVFFGASQVLRLHPSWSDCNQTRRDRGSLSLHRPMPPSQWTNTRMIAFPAVFHRCRHGHSETGFSSTNRPEPAAVEDGKAEPRFSFAMWKIPRIRKNGASGRKSARSATEPWWHAQVKYATCFADSKSKTNAPAAALLSRGTVPQSITMHHASTQARGPTSKIGRREVPHGRPMGTRCSPMKPVAPR